MTREALYVAMTRGRAGNTAYVTTDREVDPDTSHGPVETVRPRDVLAAVLGNVGADQSAHDTIRAEQDKVATIAQLAAEYETLAHTADADRWAELLAESGLSPDELTAVKASAAFGALSRRAPPRRGSRVAHSNRRCQARGGRSMRRRR